MIFRNCKIDENNFDSIIKNKNKILNLHFDSCVITAKSTIFIYDSLVKSRRSISIINCKIKDFKLFESIFLFQKLKYLEFRNNVFGIIEQDKNHDYIDMIETIEAKTNFQIFSVNFLKILKL